MKRRLFGDVHGGPDANPGGRGAIIAPGASGEEYGSAPISGSEATTGASLRSREGGDGCITVTDNTPAAITPVATAANVVSRGWPVARSV